MEAVFKLTRAEVEVACAQYLMQRAVHFAAPPTLVAGQGQDFEHLFFSGEIALAVAAPRLVAAPGRPAAHGAAPEEPSFPVRIEDVIAAPDPVRSNTVPDALKPAFVEAKLSFDEGNASAKSPGSKATLGSLMSASESSASRLLPPSVIAFRAQNEG